MDQEGGGDGRGERVRRDFHLWGTKVNGPFFTTRSKREGEWDTGQVVV